MKAREDLVNLTPHLSPDADRGLVDELRSAPPESIADVEAETAQLVQLISQRPWAGTMVPDPLSLHYRITAIERALIEAGLLEAAVLRYWSEVAARDALRLVETMTRKAPPNTGRRALERAGL